MQRGRLHRLKSPTQSQCWRSTLAPHPDTVCDPDGHSICSERSRRLTQLSKRQYFLDNANSVELGSLIRHYLHLLLRPNGDSGSGPDSFSAHNISKLMVQFSNNFGGISLEFQFYVCHFCVCLNRFQRIFSCSQISTWRMPMAQISSGFPRPPKNILLLTKWQT